MKADLLAKLLTAAEAHGAQSEAEHEAGDLQAILRSCWKRLTPQQQRAVYQEHAELVSTWLA